MGSSCGKGSKPQNGVVSPIKADRIPISSPVPNDLKFQSQNDLQKRKQHPTAEIVRESQNTKGENDIPNVEPSKASNVETQNLFSGTPSIDNEKHKYVSVDPKIRVALDQQGLVPPKVFTLVEQERLVMHQFAQIQRPLDRYVFLMALQVWTSDQ
jgi:hypothetical protein